MKVKTIFIFYILLSVACGRPKVERFLIRVNCKSLANQQIELVQAGKRLSTIGILNINNKGIAQSEILIGSQTIVGLYVKGNCVTTFFAGPYSRIRIQEQKGNFIALGNEETEWLNEYWKSMSAISTDVDTLAIAKTKQATFEKHNKLLTEAKALGLFNALAQIENAENKPPASLPKFPLNFRENNVDSANTNPEAVLVCLPSSESSPKLRKPLTWRPFYRIFIEDSDYVNSKALQQYLVFDAKKHFLYSGKSIADIELFLNQLLP